MLRTILLALDGSEDSQTALELALRWGRRFDARVIGCAVLDEPGIRVSEATLFAEGYYGSSDPSILSDARKRVDEILDLFTRRSALDGVRGETLFDTGTPHEQIVAEAHRVDLVVMGRRTHFEFGWRAASDSTLDRVVHESPRPVVAVPAGADLEEKGPVIVAFDGSVHSSRALYAFEASGLARARVVHVVSIDRERAAAEQTAMRAVDFLRFHDVEAHSHPFDGAFPPVEAILGATIETSASLLVIGAYGQSQLREFLLGSSTRTVFTRSSVPVFCAH